MDDCEVTDGAPPPGGGAQGGGTAASPSSIEAPVAATSAASMTARPRAVETSPLSTTRTGMPPVNCSAAKVADWMGALTLEETPTTTMPAAPAEARRGKGPLDRP